MVGLRRDQRVFSRTGWIFQSGVNGAFGMGHMVNHAGSFRSGPVQNGCQDLVPDAVGMVPVIVPHHDGTVVDQVFKNIPRITEYAVIVMIAIDEYQIGRASCRERV